MIENKIKFLTVRVTSEWYARYLPFAPLSTRLHSGLCPGGVTVSMGFLCLLASSIFRRMRLEVLILPASLCRITLRWLQLCPASSSFQPRVVSAPSLCSAFVLLHPFINWPFSKSWITLMWVCHCFPPGPWQIQMATESLSEEVTFKLDLWDEREPAMWRTGEEWRSRQKEVACETPRWKELVVVLKEQRRETGSVSGAQRAGDSMRWDLRVGGGHRPWDFASY